MSNLANIFPGIDRSEIMCIDYAVLGPRFHHSIKRIITNIESAKNELAQCQTNETGKPIQYSFLEIDRCLFQLAASVRRLEEFVGNSSTGIVHERSFHGKVVTRHFPLGRVLGITTVSSPFSSFIQKFIPSLFANNIFIFKPSPRARECSRLLYKLVAAGLDDMCDRLEFLDIKDDELDDRLEQIHFDALLFTGKTETARSIKRRIGRIPAVFETGSSAMAYIHADQTEEGIIDSLLHSAFDQSGMRCIALKNLFLHREIADGFICHLLDAVNKLKFGHPADPTVIVGPILHDATRSALEEEIELLVRYGYRILHGGKFIDTCYLPPTILLDEAGARKSTQEMFGPVLCLHIVGDIEHIPEEYFKRSSLNISLYAKSDSIREKFLVRARHSGTICFNYGPAVRLDSLPFGGVHDENEGKESLSSLFHLLSREQLLIDKMEK